MFADDAVLVAPSVAQLQMLVSTFKLFCRNNSLVINTEKTKCMLVNCAGVVLCSGTELHSVTEFRYLGLPICSAARCPSAMLRARITAARAAFISLKSHTRFLGVHNCRVKA